MATPKTSSPQFSLFPGEPEPAAAPAAERAGRTTEAAAWQRPAPAAGEDFTEACEEMKLAIIRHKNTGWLDVPRADVLAAIEAMKTLALAPGLRDERPPKTGQN